MTCLTPIAKTYAISQKNFTILMRHVDKSVFSKLHMTTMNNELKILNRMNNRGFAMETNNSAQKVNIRPKCFLIQPEFFDY